MDGIVPILFLLVILKIPVFAGLYLVYYAFTAEPEIEEDPAPPAAEEHGFRRWRKTPNKPPKGPRRGDHGGGALAIPDRSLPSMSVRRDPHRREPASIPNHRR
jgi:hypothetical protein